MVKYCPRCGYQNDDNTFYCLKCGSYLNNSQAFPPQQFMPQQSVPQQPIYPSQQYYTIIYPSRLKYGNQEFSPKLGRFTFGKGMRIASLRSAIMRFNFKIICEPLKDYRGSYYGLRFPIDQLEYKKANCYVATTEMVKRTGIQLNKYSIGLLTSRHALNFASGVFKKNSFLFIINDKGEGYFATVLSNIITGFINRRKVAYFTFSENPQLASLYQNLNKQFALS